MVKNRKEEYGENHQSDAGRESNWGLKVFLYTLVVVLVFFWWLLIYSGGVGGHHG